MHMMKRVYCLKTVPRRYRCSAVTPTTDFDILIMVSVAWKSLISILMFSGRIGSKEDFFAMMSLPAKPK